MVLQIVKRPIELLDDNDPTFQECMGGPDGPWRPWDEELGPFCALKEKKIKQYFITTHFGQKINYYVGWGWQSHFWEFGCYGNNKKYYVRHFKTAQNDTAAGWIREFMIDKTIQNCIVRGHIGKNDGKVYIMIPSSATANIHIANRFQKLLGCKVEDILEKNTVGETEWDRNFAAIVMGNKANICEKRFQEKRLRMWDQPYIAHDWKAMFRKPIKNTFRIKRGVSMKYLRWLSNQQIVLIDDTLAEGGTVGNVLMTLGKYGVQLSNVFLITIMEDF